MIVSGTDYRNASWIWMPPAIFFMLAGLIYLLDLNKSLFIWINLAGSFLPDMFWSWFTILGDTLVAVVLILPFARRYPQVVWTVMIALILGAIVIRTGKNLFHIPRPPAVLPPESFHLIGKAYYRHSFPSGHSFTAFTFAAILVFHCVKHRIVFMGIMLVALIVGISRIIVGVHWPADVFAGAGAGWLTGWVSVLISRKLHWGLTLWGRRITLTLLTLSAVALAFHNTDYPLASELQKMIIAVGGFTGFIYLFNAFTRPDQVTMQKDGRVIVTEADSPAGQTSSES